MLLRVTSKNVKWCHLIWRTLYNDRGWLFSAIFLLCCDTQVYKQPLLYRLFRCVANMI